MLKQGKMFLQREKKLKCPSSSPIKLKGVKALCSRMIIKSFSGIDKEVDYEDQSQHFVYDHSGVTIQDPEVNVQKSGETLHRP